MLLCFHPLMLININKNFIWFCDETVTLAQSTDRIMPYSENARFEHNRQIPPDHFIAKTLKTVPLSHTDYSGQKFNVRGTKAIVGKLKPIYRKKGRFGKLTAWKIQSILIPKK